jgi:hypothetical protein
MVANKSIINVTGFAGFTDDVDGSWHCRYACLQNAGKLLGKHNAAIK